MAPHVGESALQYRARTGRALLTVESLRQDPHTPAIDASGAPTARSVRRAALARGHTRLHPLIRREAAGFESPRYADSTAVRAAYWEFIDPARAASVTAAVREMAARPREFKGARYAGEAGLTEEYNAAMRAENEAAWREAHRKLGHTEVADYALQHASDGQLHDSAARARAAERGRREQWEQSHHTAPAAAPATSHEGPSSSVAAAVCSAQPAAIMQATAEAAMLRGPVSVSAASRGLTRADAEAGAESLRAGQRFRAEPANRDVDSRFEQANREYAKSIASGATGADACSQYTLAAMRKHAIPSAAAASPAPASGHAAEHHNGGEGKTGARMEDECGGSSGAFTGSLDRGYSMEKPARLLRPTLPSQPLSGQDECARDVHAASCAPHVKQCDVEYHHADDLHATKMIRNSTACDRLESRKNNGAPPQYQVDTTAPRNSIGQAPARAFATAAAGTGTSAGTGSSGLGASRPGGGDYYYNARPTMTRADAEREHHANNVARATAIGAAAAAGKREGDGVPDTGHAVAREKEHMFNKDYSPIYEDNIPRFHNDNGYADTHVNAKEWGQFLHGDDNIAESINRIEGSAGSAGSRVAQSQNSTFSAYGSTAIKARAARTMAMEAEAAAQGARQAPRGPPPAGTASRVTGLGREFLFNEDYSPIYEDNIPRFDSVSVTVRRSSSPTAGAAGDASAREWQRQVHAPGGPAGVGARWREAQRQAERDERAKDVLHAAVRTAGETGAALAMAGAAAAGAVGAGVANTVSGIADAAEAVLERGEAAVARATRKLPEAAKEALAAELPPPHETVWPAYDMKGAAVKGAIHGDKASDTTPTQSDLTQSRTDSEGREWVKAKPGQPFSAIKQEQQFQREHPRAERQQQQPASWQQQQRPQQQQRQQQPQQQQRAEPTRVPVMPRAQTAASTVMPEHHESTLVQMAEATADPVPHYTNGYSKGQDSDKAATAAKPVPATKAGTASPEAMSKAAQQGFKECTLAASATRSRGMLPAWEEVAHTRPMTPETERYLDELIRAETYSPIYGSELIADDLVHANRRTADAQEETCMRGVLLKEGTDAALLNKARSAATAPFIAAATTSSDMKAEQERWHAREQHWRDQEHRWQAIARGERQPTPLEVSRAESMHDVRMQRAQTFPILSPEEILNNGVPKDAHNDYNARSFMLKDARANGDGVNVVHTRGAGDAGPRGSAPATRAPSYWSDAPDKSKRSDSVWTGPRGSLAEREARADTARMASLSAAERAGRGFQTGPVNASDSMGQLDCEIAMAGVEAFPRGAYSPPSAASARGVVDYNVRSAQERQRKLDAADCESAAPALTAHLTKLSYEESKWMTEGGRMSSTEEEVAAMAANPDVCPIIEEKRHTGSVSGSNVGRAQQRAPARSAASPKPPPSGGVWRRPSNERTPQPQPQSTSASAESSEHNGPWVEYEGERGYLTPTRANTPRGAPVPPAPLPMPVINPPGTSAFPPAWAARAVRGGSETRMQRSDEGTREIEQHAYSEERNATAHFDSGISGRGQSEYAHPGYFERAPETGVHAQTARHSSGAGVNALPAVDSTSHTHPLWQPRRYASTASNPRPRSSSSNSSNTKTSPATTAAAAAAAAAAASGAWMQPVQVRAAKPGAETQSDRQARADWWLRPAVASAVQAAVVDIVRQRRAAQKKIQL